MFTPLFTLVRHYPIRHTTRLDRAAMIDVMSSSYRGLRTREREKLEQIEAMEGTLSRDVLIFR